jgi:hypothetical protein
VVQEVQHLLHRYKAMSSNPRPTIKREINAEHFLSKNSSQRWTIFIEPCTSWRKDIYPTPGKGAEKFLCGHNQGIQVY